MAMKKFSKEEYVNAAQSLISRLEADPSVKLLPASAPELAVVTEIQNEELRKSLLRYIAHKKIENSKDIK